MSEIVAKEQIIGRWHDLMLPSNWIDVGFFYENILGCLLFDRETVKNKVLYWWCPWSPVGNESDYQYCLYYFRINYPTSNDSFKIKAFNLFMPQNLIEDDYIKLLEMMECIFIRKLCLNYCNLLMFHTSQSSYSLVFSFCTVRMDLLSLFFRKIYLALY